MPQPDLEAPATPENDVAPPAGSFWLSKDAEYDWFDHSTFTNRPDESNQQRSNPNPTANILKSKSNKNNSKSLIIGLFKTPKTTADRRNCKPATIRLFPKRTGKPAAVPVAEPGSPKVSCMGRVRSKRGCRRPERTEKPEVIEEKKKTAGFYERIMGLFRFSKGPKKLDRSRSRKVAEEAAFVEPPRMSVRTAEPPGLGDMKCFASGRRSGAWTAEEFNLGEVDRRVSFGGGA